MRKGEGSLETVMYSEAGATMGGWGSAQGKRPGPSFGACIYAFLGLSFSFGNEIQNTSMPHNIYKNVRCYTDIVIIKKLSGFSTNWKLS